MLGVHWWSRWLGVSRAFLPVAGAHVLLNLQCPVAGRLRNRTQLPGYPACLTSSPMTIK
jgi:hypothetical protein